jgi:hypothetical protein
VAGEDKMTKDHHLTWDILDQAKGKKRERGMKDKVHNWTRRLGEDNIGQRTYTRMNNQKYITNVASVKMGLDSKYMNNIDLCVSTDVFKNEELSNLNTDDGPVQAKNVSTVRQLIDKFDNVMHGSGPKTQEKKQSLTEIGIKTLRNGKFPRRKLSVN